MPSDDWEMNIFLQKLAKGMTDDDLKTMKHYISGYHGTGKGVLETIKDPLDLFQHLRHRCILTRDNIVMLQAMLWHLDKKDLHNEFVKFAKKRGNLIHFYNTKNKPENGYEYLHFHVAGKAKMNRNKLEELRALVSTVLCVPLEFIVVTDIEATNSILITFMIPEGYSSIIFELDDKDKKYLGSKGVDAVWCNEQKISCTALQTTDQEESIDKNQEVMLLLEQRSKADKDLESLQTQLLEKDRQIRNFQNSLEEIKNQFEWRKFEVTGGLIQQYMEKKYTPKKSTLQDIALKNAYKYSKHVLDIADRLGYDADLLRCLIESNTLVVQSQYRGFNQWIETQQNNMIRKQQLDITTLCYERDKLAYFLKVGTTNAVLTKNEEFFLKVLGLPIPLPTAVPNTANPGTGSRQETLKLLMDNVFKMMESNLNDTEKETLSTKFLPTRSDIKAFKESKLKLLDYLWTVKEQKAKGADGADIHVWLINVLVAIKRMDLLSIWTEKAAKILAPLYPDLSRTLASQSQDKQQTPEQKQNRSRRNKPEPILFTESETGVKEMNERLTRLEEMMKRNMKLTESIASVPVGNNPFNAPYSYGVTKLGIDVAGDWSKLSQSKFFNVKRS